MQYKKLSTYRLTHFNGIEEVLNAATMQEALENAEVKEAASPIVAASRTQTDIPTLVEDVPTEVDLNVYVGPKEVVRCKAAPSSAILHSGDDVLLEAFPGEGYSFVGWKLDGNIISDDIKFLFKVPEIENPQHYNRLNVLAEFKQRDVEWLCKILPTEAEEAGCIAGPGKGISAPESPIELIACPEGTYKFDGWFRNDIELTKEKKLQTVVKPLAPDEKEADYVAKFSLKE